MTHPQVLNHMRTLGHGSETPEPAILRDHAFEPEQGESRTFCGHRLCVIRLLSQQSRACIHFTNMVSLEPVHQTPAPQPSVLELCMMQRSNHQSGIRCKTIIARSSSSLR